MTDQTYVLAGLIVLAAAIILTLIGIAVVRRFRASRWAEYDISLTERLERALGTGLPPLKVEPRSLAPSVETIATAVIDTPRVEPAAPPAEVEAPQTPVAMPAPPGPQPAVAPVAGEVWFAPEPAGSDLAARVSSAHPRPKEPSAESAVAPEETAAPEYQLTAPVELRFAGDSGVIGIRADTETAAAFRRLADELTESIDNEER